jgi:hypothetical protein
MALLLAQDQVHCPTASDVWPWLAAVGKDVCVMAPGFFEGVGKDGQAVEGCVAVDALGEGHDFGRLPSVFDSDRAKRVAEDVSQDEDLRCMFGPNGIKTRLVRDFFTDWECSGGDPLQVFKTPEPFGVISSNE